MVRRRRIFPSAQFRRCTSDLKRGPIQKFLRTIPEKFVINGMGMRAEESAQRARQSPWMRDAEMSKNGRTVYNWLPIFEETTDQVLTWHWQNAVPLHPVYVPEYHRDGIPTGMPNWEPLERAFPVNWLPEFMHMGEHGTIQLYKHRDSRCYLKIDSDSMRFYRYRDGGYVEVSQTTAILNRSGSGTGVFPYLRLHSHPPG